MATAIIVLSWLGTCLTGFTLIPQSYKVFKTKDTKSISLYMMILFIVASLVWIAFAILDKQIPILVVNCLVLISSTFITCFKVFNIVKKHEKF